MKQSGDHEHTVEVVHLCVCIRAHKRVDRFVIMQGVASTDQVLCPTSVVQDLALMIDKISVVSFDCL